MPEYEKRVFQFLIGRIKTELIDGEIVDGFEFQFLIGRIKTCFYYPTIHFVIYVSIPYR